MGLIKTGITVALLLVAFIGGYMTNGMLDDAGITGQAVTEIPDVYEWTKAICDGNECIDVTITCEGDKVIDLDIASELKEFPDDWSDPRTLDELEKICENQ